jgi:hypothetical protein
MIYFILEDGVEFRLAEDLPTLHKLINVVENGYAYKASLRDDDRLIEVIALEFISGFNNLYLTLDQWARC